MGDLVNLRRARKRRERARQADAAAENRAVFGTAKAERRKVEAEREKGEELAATLARLDEAARSLEA